jgi:uncharacterized protein YbjT (DUF2867 family)
MSQASVVWLAWTSLSLRPPARRASDGTPIALRLAMRVLLSGATGFVGSHILPQLVAAGLDVVGAARDPQGAARRHPGRTFVQLDLADRCSIADALVGVDAAVYLVHSMATEKGYDAVEEGAAHHFREAAERCELGRIVYLGGMRPRDRPSRHLASRQRTGEILRSGPVPVVELDATMIVGGGSESFRIVRDLAARLPFMLLPQWMLSESEPVDVRDVGAAIVHALMMPMAGHRVLTLPGPERLSGREILVRTAGIMGRRPRVVPVPFVTPRLSSYWIRLVTRANPYVATELVEGLRSDILSQGDAIWSEMPGYVRTTFDEAVRSAIEEEALGLSTSTLLLERALRSLAPRSRAPRSVRRARWAR